MPIVNFSIPKTLEKRIDKTVQEKGFASRAEFFRLAAIHQLSIPQEILNEKAKEEAKTQYLVKAIQEKVSQNYKGKKIPSIKEQLKDI